MAHTDWYQISSNTLGRRLDPALPENSALLPGYPVWLGIRSVLFFFALFFCYAGPASAVDRYWVCGIENWNNPLCWDLVAGGPGGAGSPQAGDNAFFPSFTGVLLDTTTTPLLGEVTFSGDETMQTGGSLNAQTEYFGAPMFGAYHVQSGGTNTADKIFIGDGGDATYELSGTGQILSNEMRIGSNGNGTMKQTGGTNTVSGQLYVGGPGFGTYDLTGGSLGVGGLTVDGATFTQNGNSTTTIATDLVFAPTAGQLATYFFFGGSLDIGGNVLSGAGDSGFAIDGALTWSGSSFTVNSLVFGSPPGVVTAFSFGAGQSINTDNTVVGWAGDATVVQNGGTHVMTGFLNPPVTQSNAGLMLGSFLGSRGEYTLNAGSIITNLLVLGRQGEGVFNQNGGVQSISVDLLMAVQDADSVGIYNLNGGVLNVGGGVYGRDGGGSSTLNIDGGTLNVAGGVIDVNDLNVGNVAGTVGSYVMGTGALETTALNARIGNLGTGSFTQDQQLVSVLYDLQLGVGATGVGSYTLNAGGVDASDLVLGQQGQATFTQNGGRITVADVRFSQALGSTGTYNLNGGQLELAGDIVSGAGFGELNIDGGSITDIFGAPGDENIQVDVFRIGNVAGTVGVYSFGANQLISTSSTIVGFDGTGTLNQDQGTHTVSGTLGIAGSSLASGEYNFRAGTLGTSTTQVGQSGIGNFSHTGGAHTVTGSLEVGVNAGGSGTYNLGVSFDTATPTLDTATSSIGVSGTGNFIHNTGTHTVTGDLVIGVNNGSNGVYRLKGLPIPTVNSANTIVGDNGTGLFTNSLIPNSGANFIGSGAHNVTSTLTLGRGVNGTGTYRLGNGALTASDIIVGESGSGTFDQQADGGSTISVNTLILAKNTGSSGNYNLGASGTLSTTFTTVGQTGTGTFTQSGGLHSVSESLVLGQNAGSSGTYNLTGGTVATKITAVGDSAGSGTFNLGGTGELTSKLLGVTATGTFNMTGGTLNLTPFLSAPVIFNNGMVNITGGTVNANGDVLNDSAGTYKLSGGSLTATNLLNYGDFEFTGGVITATTTNSGYFRADASGPGLLTLTGDYTNNFGATTKIKGSPCGSAPCFGTVINYTGKVINDGVWQSDPAETRFGTLTNSSTGVMTGVAGDQFTVLGDFTNNSEQATSWDTDEVILAFEGSGVHSFSLAGEERGNNGAGFLDNFAWDELLLGSGAGLNLWDGNAGNAGTALYTGLFTLEDGIGQLSLINSAFNIYYDRSLTGNAYLQGADFAFNGGGFLVAASSPVPVPAAVWLFGSGLAGLIVTARRNKAGGRG